MESVFFNIVRVMAGVACGIAAIMLFTYTLRTAMQPCKYEQNRQKFLEAKRNLKKLLG